MVCDGFSAVSAIWNTICIRRSSSLSRCARPGLSSRLANIIEPWQGAIRPATARASVVLPEPDSPMTPIAWPR